MSSDHILDVGIFESGVADDDLYDALMPPNPAGQSTELTISLDRSGPHAMVCFDIRGDTDTDHALLFTVAES